RRQILRHCKWDPQVGDVSTLADFPILLTREAWEELCESTRQLAAQTLTAEQELLHRPELHRALGIPWRVRRVIKDSSVAAPRMMRFDFHMTRDGWRISEVNSDVPGGYSEAGPFTEMMAEQFSETVTPGDPARAWVKALTRV